MGCLLKQFLLGLEYSVAITGQVAVLALSGFFRAVACRRPRGTTLQHLRDVSGVSKRQKTEFVGQAFY